MSVALAIFVKTPSLSPVKTRLAAGIGEAAALAFYSLSLRAVAAVARACDMHVVWAVGEADGVRDPLWAQDGFEVMHTGEGDLGARQGFVYEALLARYSQVILIGADAPQISSEILEQAVAALDEHDFVIGPARDGGYYLFGGRVSVSRNVWDAVRWSVSTTRAELEAGLGTDVFHLPVLTDVDEREDLARVVAEMPDDMNEQQWEIVEWIGRL